MFSSVSESSTSNHRPFLSVIRALDEQRRDDALFLLAKASDRPLTPYDICKTIVLADVRHVLGSGRVIFGGELTALPYGPVEGRTLNAVRRWTSGLMLAGMLGCASAEASLQSQPLRPSGWTGSRNHVPQFIASPEYGRREEADWDGFSVAEREAITSAFALVKRMNWNESQRYFHEPVSAIGYAYDVATRPFAKPFQTSVPMNWFDVLDGAEQIEKRDVSYARAALSLWL